MGRHGHLRDYYQLTQYYMHSSRRFCLGGLFFALFYLPVSIIHPLFEVNRHRQRQQKRMCITGSFAFTPICGVFACRMAMVNFRVCADMIQRAVTNRGARHTMKQTALCGCIPPQPLQQQGVLTYEIHEKHRFPRQLPDVQPLRQHGGRRLCSPFCGFRLPDRNCRMFHSACDGLCSAPDLGLHLFLRSGAGARHSLPRS